MSEMYEGVVFRSDERSARSTFRCTESPLHLRLTELADGVFGIYRVAGRLDEFDQLSLERVAGQVSVRASEAAALLYDNRCGLRVAVVYARGSRVSEFGQHDEWWVPLDADGEPIADGPRYRLNELEAGEEYDCVHSAIEAGLSAIGVQALVNSGTLKSVFCYEELGYIEDSAESD